MTTEFKSNQSPRLPENYAAHVDRILAKKQPRQWSMGFLYALTAICWLVCGAIILYSLYE